MKKVYLKFVKKNKDGEFIFRKATIAEEAIEFSLLAPLVRELGIENKSSLPLASILKRDFNYIDNLD